MNAEAKKRVGRPSARDKILKAAEQLVIQDGVQTLTLEEVAARAGVSKGGLFYHFPTKEDLLKAMVARVVELSDATEAEYEEILGGGPSSRLRAVIAVAKDRPFGDDKLSAALLAAAANDLSLLAPIREVTKQRFDKLKSSPIAFEAAAVIELAVTGLQMLELFGLDTLQKSDRDLILEWLDELAKGQTVG